MTPRRMYFPRRSIRQTRMERVRDKVLGYSGRIPGLASIYFRRFKQSHSSWDVLEK